MDSFVIRLLRVFTGRHLTAPGGTRVLAAYAALGRYRDQYTDLEPRLELLVTQLAAERSRCRWCIERGRHLWREAQLPLAALRDLPGYETSALFTTRERAALRLADALTRYSERNGGMPLEPLTRARQQLCEPEIAAIAAAVARTHFYDRVTGAFGADATAGGAPLGAATREGRL
jgi:alkylhydroperoxidase family enzyme